MSTIADRQHATAKIVSTAVMSRKRMKQQICNKDAMAILPAATLEVRNMGMSDGERRGRIGAAGDSDCLGNDVGICADHHV